MSNSASSLARHAGLGCLLSLALLAMPVVAQTAASGPCGSLETHYGPYDYRTQKDKLGIVEKHHFGPGVEALISGQEGYLGGDLSYVLNAFPNHHRALIAVMKFAERTKSPQPPHMTYSVECYFVRAIQFQREDTIVRMLYAQYLGKQQRKAEAVAQLETVERLAADNAFTHYNAGLVYFELGEFERALAAGHRAAALGPTRPELESMLRREGKWRDAPPDRPASAVPDANRDTKP